VRHVNSSDPAVKAPHLLPAAQAYKPLVAPPPRLPPRPGSPPQATLYQVTIMKARGVNAAYVRGDVREPDSCAEVVAAAVKQFGQLDVLVNSAAGNFLSPMEGLSPKGFKTVLEIDTMGVFNMCNAAFSHLKAAKGSVINITATLHYGATWWQGHAMAAKAAIDSLTRSMALEWGEFGIRVNGIAPGPIADTPGMSKLSGGISKQQLDKMMKMSVPLGRAGTVDEISSAAIFLLLNQFISGQDLIVDGANWLMKPKDMPRELVEKISKKVEKTSRDLGPGAKSKL